MWDIFDTAKSMAAYILTAITVRLLTENLGTRKTR